MSNIISKLFFSKELLLLKKENEKLKHDINELKVKSQKNIDTTNKYYKNILKKNNIQVSS